MRSLQQIISFYLESSSNLDEFLNSPLGSETYGFSLFLVGYDLDGSPKVGLLELTAKPQATVDKRRSWDVDGTAQQVTIGSQFIYGVGGFSDTARNVLGHPEMYKRSATVDRYADSLQTASGSSLSLLELEALAKLIEYKTSVDHPVEVGGSLQIAVLRDGKVERLDQPSFPDPARPMKFSIKINGTIDGSGLVSFAPGLRTLWIHCRLLKQQNLSLENNFLIATEIRDSLIFYNGGPFIFDKTNTVGHSALMLGPNVDLKSKEVHALATGFEWINRSQYQ